ncbi:hypothetical protein D3C86_2224890 [compost metagenome]
MAIAIAEELAIHRPAAQQVDHHPVLGHWVIQREGLGLLVVNRLFQAFAFAIKIHQHLTDARPLVHGFAFEANHQG